jgi:hypothetical protein
VTLAALPTDRNAVPFMPQTTPSIDEPADSR